ncbi:fungal Zn(2)-Cys(6) binuclear cluster domain-containing protein 23 [Elsinoe australis]|uniref:Fungal Zn(2)-Cys(6) binuclear cluster domain-containing protein 23 n=1 Tax=Elsinoe australis TaxID=40998 RepID=A0A4U7AW27_9PEZI|nr:fungal Zn(2)-Cys(6) binuclear cluster domain-containing protein 23 [Elsinoe australis]
MANKSPDESPGDGSRRDRAAIAAQACQTCRSRKSKCDEQRPKCGLCIRLGVECIYREPQPTKKDKTLVHILNILERVESKVDRLGMPATSQRTIPSPQSRSEMSLTGPAATWEQVENETKQQDIRSETYLPTDLISASTHLTAAHKVLVWPAVFLLLTNARVSVINDLHHIMQTGTPWFTHLELQKHSTPLPSACSPSSMLSPSVPSHSLAPGIAGLTADRIRLLADAYFDTFNVLHPILDRDTFYSDILTPVIRGGYEDRDTQACLAMLVLALGSIAIEGVSGAPIFPNTHSTSGLRGGSIEEPPGLQIFNEARRRLGFVMHTCTLENVQIYLLQAAYYEACARHMDFWRSCAAASMSFQVYIRCERIDWSSAKADLIKRVYWTCILNEDLYHLELDLPRTGIYTLEDQIPLPSFQQSRSISAHESEEASHYHYHFLAMIALRRLIARIHASLHSDVNAKAESSEDYDGPPIHLVNELARQLESWRTYLPQALQWSDADMHSFPNTNPLARRQPAPLFTVEDNNNPATHRYNLDVVTGHLRTRFYYARYMIYRPFVFKALHFPESMTPEDASYCALAVQSACLWPLAMSPCKNKKRLVPHLFTWTQNFLGILLLMRMTSESECLRQICEERVSMRDMQLTVGLMLDWINDMKIW